MIKIESRRYGRSRSNAVAQNTDVALAAGSSADPSLADIPIFASPLLDSPHQAVFYPLGFPVRILSNSATILDAAQQSWGSYRKIFLHPPLELRVGVKPARTSLTLPPLPIHSLKGNLLMNSADVDNFIIANLRTGRALGWVTEATVASQLYFRYHFLEGTILSMVSALRAVAVHGACLLVDDTGILLCGDSGAGKSTLAYAGARSGWTYVSDDASYVLLDRDDSLVVGNCHKIRFRPSASALFPEIDGRPVTPRAVGKPSVEVQTSEWPEIATTSSADIRLIVFLNRKDPRNEVVRLSPSDKIPWFLQHILPSPSSRKAQQDAIARLLTAQIYELRYQELSWAIQRINQIVRDGR